MNTNKTVISHHAVHSEYVCTENLMFSSTRNSTISRFYRWRYQIIRNIACPCPFIPPNMPIIGGGKSVLEVMAVLLGIAFFIFYCIVLCGGPDAGSASAAIVFATILFGLKNNVLTLFLGIAFERALYFHKAAAVAAIVCGIIHGQRSQPIYPLSELLSGTALTGIILLGFMMIASLIYFAKPYCFELFYLSHMLLYVGMIPLALLHGAPIIAFAAIAWIIDLTIRYFLRVHSIRAQACVLPCGVVKILFKKNFEYAASQYCFINVPAITKYQFHPFTLSSAPHEECVSFHIRSLGNWSSGLLKHVEELTVKAGLPLGELVDLDVIVEGPFGMLSVDIHNPEYKTILLVAGGIGVTPTQSVVNTLIYSHAVGDHVLSKCLMVWSVKDRCMVDSMQVHQAISMHGASSREIPNKTESFGHLSDLPFSFQPNLVNVTAIDALMDSYHQQAVAEEAILHEISLSDSHVSVRPGSVRQINGARLQMLDEVISPLANPSSPTEMSLNSKLARNKELHENPFQCEFYLTSVRTREQFAAANINPDEQPYLQFDRPNLPSIVDRIAKFCASDIDKHGNRVCVVVCGPEAMVNEMRGLCCKRRYGIVFDIHCEEFNF